MEKLRLLLQRRLFYYLTAKDISCIIYYSFVHDFYFTFYSHFFHFFRLPLFYLVSFAHFFYLIAFSGIRLSRILWTLSPMIQRIPFSLSVPPSLSLFLSSSRSSLPSFLLPRITPSLALALWDFHDRHHPRNATGIARESEERVGDTRNNFPSSFSCSTWI